MSDWYYSAGNNQRQGPLPSDDLIAQFRYGRIGLDTLVWRDGQAQWQPLRDFTTELGLANEAGAPLPPPLPSPSHRPAPVTYASAAQPAPKSGLSGCMIALIVAAVVAVPMVAILAAIAIPAYQDYTLRARTSAALVEAAPLKANIVAYLAGNPTCPSNGDADFDTPETYASAHLASITIGTFESDHCGMELILRNAGNERLDGKKIWLEYDPSDTSWECSSEIDDKYLPITCRG
jgi:type IV pilus assembly protein PilA